jgi:hypothetical protein
VDNQPKAASFTSKTASSASKPGGKLVSRINGGNRINEVNTGNASSSSRQAVSVKTSLFRREAPGTPTTPVVPPTAVVVAAAALPPFNRVTDFINSHDANGLREYFRSLSEVEVQEEDEDANDEDDEDDDANDGGANQRQYIHWKGVMEIDFFLKPDAVSSKIRDLYLATDTEGNSLLLLALEKKSYEIAAILLSYRFPSDFGNNKKEKSPLCAIPDLLEKHKDNLHDDLTEDLSNRSTFTSDSSVAPPDWEKIAAILVFRLCIPTEKLPTFLGNLTDRLVAAVVSKDVAGNAAEAAENDETAFKVCAQEMAARSSVGDEDSHLNALKSFNGPQAILDQLAYGTRSFRGLRANLVERVNDAATPPTVKSALLAFISPMKKRVEFIMCLQDAVTTLIDRSVSPSEKGAVCQRV